MARSQTAYWIMQPMGSHLRRDPPTAANGYHPAYYRATDENVADFAVIPLDLDVGREGRPSAGQAIEVILAESIAGTIPAPTFMAYSGRGTYAIWQLRQTVPNTPINHSRWRAILLRLIARTRSLELSPDPIASNPARWYELRASILGSQSRTREAMESLSTAITIYKASRPASQNGETARQRSLQKQLDALTEKLLQQPEPVEPSEPKAVEQPRGAQPGKPKQKKPPQPKKPEPSYEPGMPVADKKKSRQLANRDSQLK